MLMSLQQYMQESRMEKISQESLKQKLDTELKAQGFVIDGEFAMAGKFAQAIANAVADEINNSFKTESSTTA